MTGILDWLDSRTGYRHLLGEALYENIPGGARWRYITGSMLVFAFVTQVVTGFFLWMFYSPSSQSAWESVYYIQHEVHGGWLVRGIHHFMAQAMVILLALHLLQVVIDGAYKAPREVNFWLGLVLMKLVLGLALTGYLLPWDQKGYWATNVATNLMTLLPAGDKLQPLVVGGTSYGHQTLTRFFALHAGILPTLLTIVLVIHVALFRKHGITAIKNEGDTDETFFPKQVLFDGIGCLLVLALVMLRILLPRILSGVTDPGHWGAELGAPADPSEAYASARPEWYFLFLFQLLKYFEGGLDIIGAVVIPGAIMGVLFLMPLIGNWTWGHRFNVAFIVLVIGGAATLTGIAIYNDNYASFHAAPVAAAEPEAKPAGEAAPMDPAAKPGEAKPAAHGATADLAYARSREYLDGVHDAEVEAKRFVEIVHRQGIPKTGANDLGREDPVIRGRRLFKTSCAACHNWTDEHDHGLRAQKSSAPNLHGLGSREWIAGLLKPEEIVGPKYFGSTAHKEGEMVGYVCGDLKDKLAASPENAKLLEDAIVALSAQAQRGDQKELDAEAVKSGQIERGNKAIVETFGCTDCHKFGDEGDLGSAPDLTGYGSQDWLVGMISDPQHERFYDENNDRMPSYAAGEDVRKHELSRKDIELIARWLRGDYE